VNETKDAKNGHPVRVLRLFHAFCLKEIGKVDPVFNGAQSE
jgi:hypothetical protein